MKLYKQTILFTIFLFAFFFFANKCNANNISYNIRNLQKNKKNYTELVKTDFSDSSVMLWKIQANPEDVTVTTNPTNSSKNVLKVHMNINEDFSHVANGSPRAEIVTTKFFLENDSEYLIEFKTYLPDDFRLETSESNPHCFFQVHQNISTGSPQLLLGIDRNEYQMTSDSAVSFLEHKKVIKYFGNVKKDLGKWVKWTIFYTPSFGENGKVIILKNNRTVLNYKGVCAYNNTAGYLKFGIYKWNWQKTPTTVTDMTTYFSNINIYKLIQKDTF